MGTKAATWTLDELGGRVKDALSGYVPAVSGRVRAVPDRRTIRYYTTLGLIDRPAEMRGRTALYGRRHLLQLVAIKRLQAEGLTLTEVQVRLTGLDDARLEELARLDEAAPEAEAPRREAFWASVPPPVASEAPPVAPPESELEPIQPVSLTGIPLTEGVTLLLGGRPLGGDDARAIRRAAGPLLRELRSRGII